MDLLALIKQISGERAGAQVIEFLEALSSNPSTTKKISPQRK
jgi:hypothetical protein